MADYRALAQALDPYAMDTGGITPDTIKALKTVNKSPNLLGMIADIGRGGLSNLESLVRGGVAQFGGTPVDTLNTIRTPYPMEVMGDVNYAPDKQVYGGTKDILGMMPKRVTQARPETAGMEELGTIVGPGLAKAAMPAVRAGQKGLNLLGMEVADRVATGQSVLPSLLKEPQSVMFAVEPKNIASSDLSYRGQHEAPGPDFGAPLHDLTGGGQMYPADIYSPKAAQYYGGGMPYDQKAFAVAQQYKDKPDATVTIYRAVPKEMSNSEKLANLEKQMAAYMKRGTLPQDATTSNGSKWYDSAYAEREKLRQTPDTPSNDISNINAGDWVTLTREYAKDHGESALRGQYKIISKKVKAKDIWTNADSIHEFGYQPQ